MTSPIRTIRPLGLPWETEDPFLFCVHHDDAYPAGNGELGPKVSLAGRVLGQDFEGREGWRMYHGRKIPGFPRHPHRGFETVTIVRRGYVDHSDSLGATARYGQGDVQWLTAGAGVVHAEMFPLLNEDASNPLELFQIWLNLPASEKFAPPHFSMFWQPEIPRIERCDRNGHAVELLIVAGSFEGTSAPEAPPHSYAARPDSEVAIWTIRLAAHATLVLPPASSDVRRTLYFFKGSALLVGGDAVKQHAAIRIDPRIPVELRASDDPVELLMLQGRPIGEPVVAHGPFVMNSRAEIERAFYDYQVTEFGGWPWQSDAPVHGNELRRFAKHSDGRVELPSDAT